MEVREIIQAWGLILSGRAPSVSIEITRECPLTCPGCYAYEDHHLGNGTLLREVSDYRGNALVEGILGIVHRERPLHVSLVGGEPLVRYRELTEVLPKLARIGVHTQVVTSAVRPIPAEWAAFDKLSVVVSIDGLQPEHDERRKPATYERILQHIVGQRVTVHCTVTRQMTHRADYLREFVGFWSDRPEIKRIWMSLFTPQVGATDAEILPPDVRRRVIDELAVLRREFPKLDAPDGMLEAYRRPPASPETCIFAKTTRTFTADLQSQITPCQLGGEPDCSQCGCVAAAALTAVGRHRLPGGLKVGAIYDASHTVGRWVGGRRDDEQRLPSEEATAAR